MEHAKAGTKRLVAGLTVILWVTLSAAQAQDYRVVEEKDHSFGNVRYRINARD